MVFEGDSDTAGSQWLLLRRRRQSRQQRQTSTSQSRNKQLGFDRFRGRGRRFSRSWQGSWIDEFAIVAVAALEASVASIAGVVYRACGGNRLAIEALAVAVHGSGWLAIHCIGVGPVVSYSIGWTTAIVAIHPIVLLRTIVTVGRE